MSEEVTNRWSDDYSGRWSHRAYMIVPVADIDAADNEEDGSNALIDNAIQSSKETLRKNNGETGDSSKALLKFACDNEPDNDPEVFASYDKYSHSQIMNILAKTDWTSDVE
tara:strand:- start:21015 stop:21347 length:333 start_codon:yes stop_codon:yes gene_type:complete